MNFEQVLSDATKHIEQNYFMLPISGFEDPIYRERVYCYELYHQLRVHWPHNTRYMLSGEVDKAGHPLVRGNNLDRTKPDLLVHIPGNMEGNHTVIEVKPINTRSGILKDLRTLTAFRRYANYGKGFYLFFGDGEIDSVIAKAIVLKHCDKNNLIDLNLIEFWWHRYVGAPATSVSI